MGLLLLLFIFSFSLGQEGAGAEDPWKQSVNLILSRFIIANPIREDASPKDFENRNEKTIVERQVMELRATIVHHMENTIGNMFLVPLPRPTFSPEAIHTILNEFNARGFSIVFVPFSPGLTTQAFFAVRV